MTSSKWGFPFSFFLEFEDGQGEILRAEKGEKATALEERRKIRGGGADNHRTSEISDV